MAWLEYGGRLRKLPEGSVVVGSGSDAGLLVDDMDLMPRHLVLQLLPQHVEVRAFSPDVVVAVGDQQVGTEPTRAAYGTAIHAGAAEFRVWREQPAPREEPARREPASMALAGAFLVDEQAKAAFPLDRQTTNIGRASANVIRLNDPTASRFHAQVRREAGGFALHVSGSAGGSVNGHRISGPCLLREGDQVELAYRTFRFTRGPLAAGLEIVPPPDEDRARAERPTMVRERISLGHAAPGLPPRIIGTAVVVGVVLMVAVAVVLVAIL